MRNIPGNERPFAAVALTQASQYLNVTLLISLKFYKPSLTVGISKERLFAIPSTYLACLIVL